MGFRRRCSQHWNHASLAEPHAISTELIMKRLITNGLMSAA
jgi:hypothetical protein